MDQSIKWLLILFFECAVEPHLISMGYKKRVNTTHRHIYGTIPWSTDCRLSRTMVSQGLQILGVMLSMTGWLGTIITCALPMWRVTAFIGANIVTAQVIWEGLWMNCVVQSTGQMQCKVYDSLLALPQDLQAARAMVIISIIVGIFGVLMAVIGGKCTNCMEDESAKAKACIVSGVIFLIAAFLILIPVSWSAQTLIRDFYNPLVLEAQRRELGACLYIGWGSAALLLLGGGLLCWNCPPKENQQYTAAKFAPARSFSPGMNYVWAKRWMFPWELWTKVDSSTILTMYLERHVFLFFCDHVYFPITWLQIFDNNEMDACFNKWMWTNSVHGNSVIENLFHLTFCN